MLLRVCYLDLDSNDIFNRSFFSKVEAVFLLTFCLFQDDLEMKCSLVLHVTFVQRLCLLVMVELPEFCGWLGGHGNLW